MAIDTTELRSMVRDVLREAMATRGTAGTVAVRITSDADLQALMARLAAPGGIEAVRAGTLRFTLAATDAPPSQVSGALLEGVISERKLAGATPGSTIRLAATAIVTPMAKDMARRLGLTFERIER